MARVPTSHTSCWTSVFGATYAAVRLGVGAPPSGASWRQLYGVSLLAGIGFTMSLFIAGLAYGEETPRHLQAKFGILAASLVSVIAGVAVLARRGSARPAGEAA